MSERKYCSKCQGHPKVEKFEEGYKTCNTCRAKEKRYQERNKEKIAERKKAYTEKHKEHIKEREHQRFLDNKDEIITCPICKYDIKKYKKSQHEKSQTHQRNLKHMQ